MYVMQFYSYHNFYSFYSLNLLRERKNIKYAYFSMIIAVW